MQNKPAHPAAEIFRAMTEAEISELATDIAAHGLREPIVLHPDGSVLDGRNRLAACALAKVEPRFTQWETTGTPEEFVISMNLHRRHLTMDEKKALAAMLIEQDPERSARSIAKVTNLHKNTVTGIMESMENNVLDQGGQNAHPAKSKKPGPAKERRALRTSANTISLPADTTMMDVGRRIVELVDAGHEGEKIIAELGLHHRTFAALRDIALLDARTDLSQSEAATVTQAISDLEELRQIKTPYKSVQPIVHRIWGGGRGSHSRLKDETKRREHFENALAKAVALCTGLPEIDIPHIGSDELNATMAQIRRAQGGLTALRRKIKESQE